MIRSRWIFWDRIRIGEDYSPVFFLMLDADGDRDGLSQRDQSGVTRYRPETADMIRKQRDRIPDVDHRDRFLWQPARRARISSTSISDTGISRGQGTGNNENLVPNEETLGGKVVAVEYYGDRRPDADPDSLTVI